MTSAFRKLFGAAPAFGVRAPGRVDLMGSHTDYNDGLVLTLPIDREAWILARPRTDDRVNLASLNMGSRVTFEVGNPGRERIKGWGRYAQGIAVELRRAGYRLGGCDALLHGTVPLASGLSSSAALEAACATLFEALGGFTMDPVEKALLAQRAENRWVGVNCGILDQYSSILGESQKALLLDCRSLSHRCVNLPEDLRIVICNTCAPRELSGSEYGDRRSQCEQGAAYFTKVDPGVRALRDVPLALFEMHEAKLPDKAARRSRFVIEENLRVAALADALNRDDRSAIGAICAASFTGARDLFEISVPVMQAMMNAMNAAPGCVGCRQAGAGFGGCLVAIVEKEQVDVFCEGAAAGYRKSTALEPEIYPVLAAAGAGTLDGF